jgi:hypothetical protein
MASFSFADQDVFVCIASEDKNRDTDVGARHDDTCPERISEKDV